MRRGSLSVTRATGRIPHSSRAADGVTTLENFGNDGRFEEFISSQTESVRAKSQGTILVSSS